METLMKCQDLKESLLLVHSYISYMKFHPSIKKYASTINSKLANE